ncbi:MAG: hypothetical protein ACLTDX_05530 [[Clostridium] innocuum]
MKYMGSLYAVDDKERTIAFYKEVCGLRVIQDFGTNFTMTGGISFQIRESWADFLEKEPMDVHYGGNDAELLFWNVSGSGRFCKAVKQSYGYRAASSGKGA